MSNVFLIFSILLWSSTKFLVGSGIALATLNPLEGAITTMIGGVAGVVVWVFFGHGLRTKGGGNVIPRTTLITMGLTNALR